MATPTTYYNLLKALVGEVYDVNLTNNNLDKLDTALHNTDVRVKTASKVIGWGSANTTWGNNPQAALTAGTADMDRIPGSIVVTTDASGYAAIDLPTSFLNGYYVVSLLNGDTIAQANITISLSTGVFTNTSSRFYVRVVTANTGTALASGTCRINYSVEGW